MKTIILTKRAYEKQSLEDGYRIYVDRLWPRGLSHDTFHYDFWDKQIAPSTELRKWFHENPTSEWVEFETRYKKELINNPAFDNLKKLVSQKPIVTLLYSSHDTEHNNALVLRDLILSAI